MPHGLLDDHLGLEYLIQAKKAAAIGYHHGVQGMPPADPPLLLAKSYEAGYGCGVKSLKLNQPIEPLKPYSSAIKACLEAIAIGK